MLETSSGITLDHVIDRSTFRSGRDSPICRHQWWEYIASSVIKMGYSKKQPDGPSLLIGANLALSRKIVSLKHYAVSVVRR